MSKFRAIIGAASLIILSFVAFHPSSANASVIPYQMHTAQLRAVSSVKPVQDEAVWYTVKKGDTLSVIAGKYHMSYQRLGAANQIKNCDLILAGERIRVPAGSEKVTGGCAVVQEDVKTAVPVTQSVIAEPAYHAPKEQVIAQSAPSGTYNGSSSMQQCIIARESGGNPDVWNATGHWGLYQFSASTWAAHGGNPADFGSAGIGEQNQVFYNTVAADGYSDWAPYDGC
jgi:LysM repeat protein